MSASVDPGRGVGTRRVAVDRRRRTRGIRQTSWEMEGTGRGSVTRRNHPGNAKRAGPRFPWVRPSAHKWRRRSLSRASLIGASSALTFYVSTSVCRSRLLLLLRLLASVHCLVPSSSLTRRLASRSVPMVPSAILTRRLVSFPDPVCGSFWRVPSFRSVPLPVLPFYRSFRRSFPFTGRPASGPSRCVPMFHAMRPGSFPFPDPVGGKC